MNISVAPTSIRVPCLSSTDLADTQTCPAAYSSERLAGNEVARIVSARRKTGIMALTNNFDPLSVSYHLAVVASCWQGTFGRIITTMIPHASHQASCSPIDSPLKRLP